MVKDVLLILYYAGENSVGDPDLISLRRTFFIVSIPHSSMDQALTVLYKCLFTYLVQVFSKMTNQRKLHSMHSIILYTTLSLCFHNLYVTTL